MLIDTHTHLYDRKFNAAPGELAGSVEAVDRAVAAGVGRMLLPGCELADVTLVRELQRLRPDALRIAMALHPTEMGPDWRGHLKAVMAELRAHTADYVAVGECGIDLYWEQDTLPQQMQVFDAQLSFAAEAGLPVLIHCRKAPEQTVEVLKGHPGVKAVFHSFEGSRADVEMIRRTGDYYFGVNGIVTFKNTTLREVLPSIGLERILLETDSPYLAPVPYRGRRNESAYLPYIASTVAQTLGLSEEDVAAATTANALELIPALA